MGHTIKRVMSLCLAALLAWFPGGACAWGTDALAPHSLLQHAMQQQDHRQRLAKGLQILEQILEDVANGIDVRGLSEGENATMTPDLAYALGIALAQELRERIPLYRPGRKPRVLITGDHRWSTPSLCQSLEDALRRFGVDIVRCAEPVSTPAANIVARLREPGMKEDPFDALVQITASHNPWTRPKAQNGFKVNLKDEAGYLRGVYGAELAAMLRRVRSDAARDLPPAMSWGSMHSTRILDKYIEHLRVRWASLLKAVGVMPEDMKNIVMVVDSGNGVMGPVVKRTLEALGIPYVGVHDEVLTAVDSNPAHRADPNEEKHYRTHLPEEVRRAAADPAYAGKIVLGAALDGDGDRVGITDEAGEHCRYLTFAQQAYVFRLADRERNATVPELLDIRSSEECMESRAKQSYLGAPGWPRIRKRMREVGAWSASESSRHEFDTPFPEDLNADRIDDGLWAALKAAGEAARYRKKAIPFGSRPTSLCEVLNRPWYPMLPELRPAVHGATRAERYKLIPAITQKLRNALQTKFGTNRIEELRAPEEPDAVRFRMHDEIGEFLGWLLVRAGNSENALSISAQGRDEACLRSIVSILQQTLQEFPQVDQDSIRKAVYAMPDGDFVIGGVNHTDTIRALKSLNGIPLAKLEETLRPGRAASLPKEAPLKTMSASDMQAVNLILANGMHFSAGRSQAGIPTLQVHSNHGNWSYPHIVEFFGSKDMMVFAHLDPADMQPRYFGGDAFSEKLEEISRLDYEACKALVHSEALARLREDLAAANRPLPVEYSL